ncbi:hypothetical protein [Hymenobacter sp. YC55]|uniref:hypothetical protein n=1 Tax=Hymenobacter sp. YC55 TaxID=3034019 RepID=UPI0023F9EFCB|nr:hypothetical protein [Hymenobacter sp. YC55]MDF7811974.1 hypothetical protein [Hymenobacter sp. YC55]
MKLETITIRINAYFGRAIIIAIVLIMVIVILPFLPFTLIYSHFANKKFEKQYSEYLQQANGACFFFYNNRKSSVTFSREILVPKLAPTVRKLFVEGTQIISGDDLRFLSTMLAGVKDRKGFPYLLKVMDGQVIDCSINHQFYNTMSGNKPIEPLLAQINSFYTSTAPASKE